ncbi:MAG: ribonucleoside-diphosphate reductase, adenosylcobalamin-dependent [Candidatus Marinimicrobia bacterium CG08_land_8_20_14_0_20_45_22]|nr:MAG: ribonucleoside-diphosphate reductase, adenosylcobalamin-dependent [Candidatus Marinimicrobia bacterium CG08_land_8_20_14_0_20_45_22]
MESEKPIFSENAIQILNKRYLIRDKMGNILETPDQMLHRVADAAAEADSAYTNQSVIQKTAEKFYRLMLSKDFLPNSPTLMNAGRDLGQLSACFVLPIDDSMESIFQTLKDTAMIHKSGGGTGFSFSRIRPKKSVVKSTSGIASGPVSFMKAYNAATEAVKQGGTRRGANMGILRVDHPDILEFVNCKLDERELVNFNISVAVTDDFMEKVRRRKQFELINPVDGTIAGTLNASEVFKLIATNAWKNGDPGILFIDRINKQNPTPKLGDIEATNPCGEQPLLPNESCNLGSINLANFIRDSKIEYERLGEVVDTSVHFLDNIIDVNKYPLKKMETMVKKTRKIGLGVMGFADLLYQLKIPYNSDEALKIADEVMKFIYIRAREASVKLGETRGTFSAWNESVFFPDGPKYRNATTITIAPTGTISMIAEVSSGIEPVFSLVFTKRVMDGIDFLYANPLFERACKEAGIYSSELMKKVQEKGSVQNIDEIPENIKKIFVTAHDISPEWHVRMQAAFQKWVDAAVSKTCNFPKSATVQDVIDAYWLAYEAGCKGITIYRDGSRDEQVLYVGDKAADDKKLKSALERGYILDQTIHPRIRPSETRGVTKRIRTGQGTLYVTINEDDEGLCEVFTNIGKAGGPAQVESEAISRLISLALRSGIDARDIIKQIKGIGGPEPVWENGSKILSTPDAIAKAMEWHLDERGGKKKTQTAQSSFSIYDSESPSETMELPSVPHAHPAGENKKSLVNCPVCGAALYHESGCVSCPSCGYSKC